MKLIRMINHCTQPDVFDYKAGEEPTVSDDLADYLVGARHAVVLKDIEDPPATETKESMEKAEAAPAKKSDARKSKNRSRSTKKPAPGRS